ncbi:MAG: LacI family DNA-binding transcriptional regulator [Lachnospiraceae bacterium]
MANVREVARRANVSVATVSRVLNNSSRVREDTKKVVLTAIEELEYISPRQHKEDKEIRPIKILALLPDVENPFYSAIAEGICDMARKKNCMVLLCTTASQYENEQKFLQMLSLNLADGAILCSSVMDREELRELNQKYPLIQCCEYKEKLECVPHISVDNYAAGYDAVQHLINVGHKKIAMISCNNGFLSTRERENAYKDVLQKNNIEFKNEYVARAGTDYGFRSGMRAMNQLLNLPDAPTAVFVISDIMAIGAIQAVIKAGMSVPEDVAIIGFDDLEIASNYNPPLSTVYQPKKDMGRLAIELLIDRICTEDDVIGSQFLEHEVRIRQSTVK